METNQVQFLIGGGHIPTILNISRFQTREELFYEMLNPQPEVQKNIFRWGYLLQEYALRKYEIAYNCKFEREYEMIRGIAKGHFDGYNPDFTGVDVKSLDYSQRKNFGSPGSCEIPEDINYQCQWYMMLTHKPYWQVIAVFDDLRIREKIEIPESFSVKEIDFYLKEYEKFFSLFDIQTFVAVRDEARISYAYQEAEFFRGCLLAKQYRISETTLKIEDSPVIMKAHNRNDLPVYNDMVELSKTFDSEEENRGKKKLLYNKIKTEMKFQGVSKIETEFASVFEMKNKSLSIRRK